MVIGELDRMTPAGCGHELANAIPDAMAVEFPGIGHMIPMEAPDAVLSALRSIV
jgi:pimeloyl-ACP methyl ester carboxylesterase